ncbi:MAG TPA: vitamin K epoxide reductase family protein [Gemmatimonadaceae bacterium]|nr:vitamin K epoxide reductase family protein [Gemmatimonadaceae bacterium]
MNKRMIVAALALAGIFLAVYLLLYKLGMIGELSCSVGSCEKVNTSKWATFLGLPVAAWGVGWYIVMFVLAVVSTWETYAESPAVSMLLLGVAGTGLIFSTYLTYLELFVIHAICQWCVVSAILVVIIFGFCIADYRDSNRGSELQIET